MNIIKLSLFILMVILSCCDLKPQAGPPPDILSCADGCQHLQHLVGRDGKMGCEESRDLIMPDGKHVSCVQFCQETQSNGRDLEPKCWLTVSSCQEVDRVCR